MMLHHCITRIVLDCNNLTATSEVMGGRLEPSPCGTLFKLGEFFVGIKCSTKFALGTSVDKLFR